MGSNPNFIFRDPSLPQIWDKVQSGRRLESQDGLALFATEDIHSLGLMAAWEARRRHGNRAYFVVNRQCNPTNICALQCEVCQFKAKKGDARAWEMSTEQVVAQGKGDIREIHITGSLHPDWGLDRALEMIKALRQAYPALGIKAFTAVEVEWFSRQSKVSIEETLKQLQAAGVDMLAGGGAEIFAPRVRQALFPNKIPWEKWVEVHARAHEIGLKSNATMLYGHIETDEERVDHLLKLRTLQDQAPGFMAFVPLAFQPGSSNIKIRPGGSIQDSKVTAVSRLLLDNFDHIKAYWVTLGEEMASLALLFGATDLDGTIGQERVAHAAGAKSPEGLAVSRMERLIKQAGLTPVERDIFYKPVEPEC